MTLTALLQIIGLFGAAIGLFFNYKQLRANSRQKTAEFIINLNNAFSQNKAMDKIYYQIEYGKFEYSQEFHTSPTESALDDLLDYFESIAKLYLLSNFTLKDLESLSYNYLVVYQDNSIQKYLAQLDVWYEARGMKVKPYSDFRQVGKTLEEKYFDKRLLKESSQLREISKNSE